MTLHEERVSATVRTRQFLYELLNPKQTPKVPLAIRKRARSLLRHYPTPYDAEKAWPPQFDKPQYT